MGRQVDVSAVEGILYGIYKATYNVMGDSSASLLRKAASDIFSMIDKSGEEFSDTDSLENIEKQLNEKLKDTGICDKIALSQDDDLLKLEIKNYAFSGLTKRLMDEGLPAVGCPFDAIAIIVAERFLNKKARLKNLEPAVSGEADMQVVVQLS